MVRVRSDQPRDADGQLDLEHWLHELQAQTGWHDVSDLQRALAAVREIGRAPSQLSSWAEEPDGELLMTCFDGKVYRLMALGKKGE